MAAVERDGGDDVSSTEENRPRARRNLSTARSDKPIFTSLHNRERITFAKKDRGGDENARPGPESGSGRANWMSGRGMKLGEAFHRTDAEGNFLPRLSARKAESSASRIPRTKSFSPPSASPSPAHRATNILNVHERSSSAPVDSESDITGLLQGSPSPAARNRRDKRESRTSNVSQTSSGDIKTGEADEKLRQYADDQERGELLRSLDGSPLFSRATVGPKVEETGRTLAEKTSVSSFENEPPVRVPKSWGSKAKKNSDWMAKILSPETSIEIQDLPRDVSSEKQRAVADIPLPSVEDISSVQTLTPPASRPASARPINLSPEKSQMWQGDLDFTAQSLQISTSPLLRVKPTKLDEIRAREIDSLTARAVATNRLEEIREKISEERSIADDIARAGLSDPDSRGLLELGDLEEGASILARNGHQVPSQNSRMTGGKVGSSNERGERELDASQREGHDDTWQTLRALSRVLTSKSPSPPRMDEKEVSQPIIVGPSTGEKVAERQTTTRREISSRVSAADANTDIKRNSGASTPPKSDADPEERITAEARLFELQDNKSERNSIRVPSRSPSPSDDGKFDETPRPLRLDPMLLPTPRVSGAFIETPAPSTRKQRKSRSIPPSSKDINVASEGVSSERRGSGRAVSDTSSAAGNARRRLQQQSGASRRSQSRPLLNSARPTTVAEDLRRIKLEAQLEDSTMEDFDAILEAHTRATVDSENNTTILEPILDLEYDERGLPLSAKEIARRVELLTLDRMCQSIKNTSSSIRDARHGIERLEHQVSSSSMSAKDNVDTLHYIKIPFPRLITYTPDVKSGRMGRSWKLTWFGFIITIFFSWLISETVTCNEFCHVNQSLNPIRTAYSDPFFPWAIPTKLDQWTGEVASNLFWDAWVGLGGERPSVFGKPKPCDWWLGRDGPVGIVKDENYEGKSIFSDEMI
jgi:hypothetical protein